jgi:polar amino acid transport system substrate-binding protein
MNKRATLLSLVIAFGSTQALGNNSTIRAVTEKSPITEQSERDPRGGAATRFVDRVLHDTQLPYRLEFMPWRRGYHHARADKNVMIYPLARTRGREKDFHWVGQLIPINYYFFKLKSRDDIQVSTLEDARAYRIGVVNYHAHHELLLNNHFEQLQAVNSNAQNLKKLLLDRIDLFPISGGGALALCKSTGIDCNQIEPVLRLDDISGGLYMAFSLNTPDDIVSKARESYQALVANGRHREIFQSRLNSIELFNRTWPQVHSVRTHQ